MENSRQLLRQIGPSLADSLATLETRFSTLAPAAVRGAVLQTWERLVEDALSGAASLSTLYLADVHRQLATLAGGESPGVFVDDGHPPLPQSQVENKGRDLSWAMFLKDVSAMEAVEPSFVLAQVRWGGHVRSLALSLGWLAMNLTLITSGEAAIVPPVADHARLLQYLEYAGPDLYDAESLRFLLGQYAAEQGEQEAHEHPEPT